jgi:hypothetical protein
VLYSVGANAAISPHRRRHKNRPGEGDAVADVCMTKFKAYSVLTREYQKCRSGKNELGLNDVDASA